jgi:hypothetical protein
VWQASCVVLQFNRQATFGPALVVPAVVTVLAAPAAVVGSWPGSTHVVRQFAAAELQIIMQLVVFDVCASRSFCSAEAPGAAAHRAAAQRANAKNCRMKPPLATPCSGHHSVDADERLRRHDVVAHGA